MCVVAMVTASAITVAPGADVFQGLMIGVPFAGSGVFTLLARRLGRLPAEHALRHNSWLKGALLVLAVLLTFLAVG